MRIHCIVFAAILAMLCPACEHSPTGPVPPGAFAYISYDSNGVAVASGWFTMTSPDSSGIFSGEWHFKPVGKPQHIGPQTGDGILIGGACHEGICVELNPQYADRNLRLAGTLAGNRYSGEWTWISYVGVSGPGSFEAVRK